MYEKNINYDAALQNAIRGQPFVESENESMLKTIHRQETYLLFIGDP